MKVKMNYFLLMLVPLCFALLTLLIKYIETNFFQLSSTTLVAVWSIMCTVGLVIAVPIYLAILNGIYIFKFDLAIWKGFAFSVSAILLNAIIACPYSVWSYITHGKYVMRSTNDYLDMFPLYAGIPLAIITITMIVMKIIAVVKAR